MGNVSYDDASLSPEDMARLQKHEEIFKAHLPACEFVWKGHVNLIRLIQKVGGMNGEVVRCSFYRSALGSDPVDKILTQIELEFPPAQPS